MGWVHVCFQILGLDCPRQSPACKLPNILPILILYAAGLRATDRFFRSPWKKSQATQTSRMGWNATWKGHHTTPCIRNSSIRSMVTLPVHACTTNILYTQYTCMLLHVYLTHLRNASTCSDETLGYEALSRSENSMMVHHFDSTWFNSILDNLAVSQPGDLGQMLQTVLGLGALELAFLFSENWGSGSSRMDLTKLQQIIPLWIHVNVNSIMPMRWIFHNFPVHLVPNTTDCSQVINKPLFGQPWQWAGAVQIFVLRDSPVLTNCRLQSTHLPSFALKLLRLQPTQQDFTNGSVGGTKV